MFLFLISLLSEKELNSKMESLSNKIDDKYNELYKVSKSLENLKVVDQKLRNRLSYIENSDKIKYETQKGRKITVKPVKETRGIFGSKTVFEYLNIKNFVTSIIKFDKSRGSQNFPDEYSVQCYVNNQVIDFPQQKVIAGEFPAIVLPNPMLINKIIVTVDAKNASFPNAILTGY